MSLLLLRPILSSYFCCTRPALPYCRRPGVAHGGELIARVVAARDESAAGISDRRLAIGRIVAVADVVVDTIDALNLVRQPPAQIVTARHETIVTRPMPQ